MFTRERNTNQTQRYTELDSLRGLAALTVFFSHMVMSAILGGPAIGAINYTPLHLFWDGGAAVSFFFILSGFVLSLPFYQNKPLFLFGFWFKRICRIYPAFIAAILIAVTLKTWIYHPGALGHLSAWINNRWEWNTHDNLNQIIKTLTLVGNYNTELIDPVIWSLVVEMNISLLIPFLVFIILKNNPAFSILFILVLLYVGINFYVCMFFAGALLAKYKESIGHYISGAPAWQIVFLSITGIILYTGTFTFHLEIAHHLHDYLTALGSCIFIMLALYRKGFSFFLNNKICRFLGKISYSFYLLHLPVIITVASVIPFTYSQYPLLTMFTSLFCTIGISYLVYSIIEMPLQHLAAGMVKRSAFFEKIKFT